MFFPLSWDKQWEGEFYLRGEKKKKQRETLSSGVEIMGGTDLSAYYKQRLKSFAGKICQEDGQEKHGQH